MRKFKTSWFHVDAPEEFRKDLCYSSTIKIQEDEGNRFSIVGQDPFDLPIHLIQEHLREDETVRLTYVEIDGDSIYGYTYEFKKNGYPFNHFDFSVR